MLEIVFDDWNVTFGAVTIALTELHLQFIAITGRTLQSLEGRRPYHSDGRRTPSVANIAVKSSPVT